MVLSPPHNPPSSATTRLLHSLPQEGRKYTTGIWSELLGRGQEEEVCRNTTLCSFPLLLGPEWSNQNVPGCRIPD